MKKVILLLIITFLLTSSSLYSQINWYTATQYDVELDVNTGTLVKFTTNAYSHLIIPDSIYYAGQYVVIRIIGEMAFQEHGGLNNLILPESLERIEQRAFLNDDFISDYPLTIPGNVEYIGNWAFSGSVNTDLIFADSDSDKDLYIDRNAFRFAYFYSLDFGNRKITIGPQAFAYSLVSGGSSNYKNYDLTLPDNIQFVGDSAFYETKFFKDVIIGNGVKHIGDYAFADNQNSGSYFLGSGLQTIGESAFKNSQLDEIVIPNNVKKIGIWAFAENSISNVHLGDSLEVIGGSAFKGNNLSAVSLPDRVWWVGDDAFSDNSLVLTSIALPHPVFRDGYEFVEWKQSFPEQVVTEITDFSNLYIASFNKLSYTVGGSIEGASDVTVTITGDVNDSQTGINAGESYSFIVQYGDSIKITPSKTGEVFDPPFITISEVKGNMNDLDFNASLPMYKLSGTIIGAEEVTVTLSGDYNESQIVTEDYGIFEFSVVQGSNVTITPSKSGYVFIPEDSSIIDIQSDIDLIDFFAFRYYEISGNVTGAGNVTMYLEDLDGTLLDYMTIQNDGGPYSFFVYENENVVVYPEKDGYTFTPIELLFSAVSESFSNQNFTAEKEVGITNNSRNGVIVYPNPSKDVFSINVPESINCIEIFDLKGTLIMKKKVNPGSILIDLSNQNPAVYILRLSGIETTHHAKIILK